MNAEFISALEQIAHDKGISTQVLVEALQSALLNAYKKNFGTSEQVRVDIDPGKGEIKVFTRKTVKDKPSAQCADQEIALEEARELYSKTYQEGDVIETEVTPKDFGRIAAQTARQMVIQKIKEAEREVVFEEFTDRQNEMITGEISRLSKGNVYVTLSIIGKNHNTLITEAVLSPTEQIPTETYEVGKRLKVFVMEVKRTNNVPTILVSRAHPDLVKRLFESEVPEIYDGVIQIRSISREAGARTKMSVCSIDENVDPIGACVGPKGQRVRNIVDELRGEKIDIIQYSEDPAAYISAALSPSQVISVCPSKEEKTARVVVPDDKLSLAIGKEGQNARLAAKLTGWKIDIKSESQA